MSELNIDFVFVGPPKSGSTWLYQLLSEHPEITVPRAKDIFYFDRNYEKGPEWFNSQLDAQGSEGVVVGDVGHDYIFDEAAMQRIAALPEDVRVFAIVREHADWALSSYFFATRNGRFSGSFTDFLTQRPDAWRLEYSALLAPVANRTNFRVFLFDDLSNDPVAFAQEILEYLGVDSGLEEVEAMAARHVNRRMAARWAFANRVLKGMAPRLRQAGFGYALQRLKMSLLVRRLLFVESRDGEASEAERQSAMDSVRQHFAEDTRRLGSLAGIDVSAVWRSSSA